MATISAMANNTYSLYKFAMKNGVSSSDLVNSVNSGADNLTGSSVSSWYDYTSTKKSKSSNSSLSSLYGNSSAASDLHSLNTVKSGMSGLLASYNDASRTFHAEFNSSMQDLYSAAAKISDTNFNVGKNAITETKEKGKDGKDVTVYNYNDALKTAISNVTGLVDKYNKASSFFSDNKDISVRIKDMAGVFADTTYRAGSYQQIGINVASDGKMSVNTEMLAKAITEKPSTVASVLGDFGLAGKAKDHVAYAQSQQDKLFPSVSKMLGNEIKTTSLYTGSAVLNMTNYASVGNLVDMFF